MLSLHAGRNARSHFSYERRRGARGWADWMTHDFDIVRLGRWYVALERAR